MMGRLSNGQMAVAFLVAMTLAGCEDGKGIPLFQKKDDAETQSDAPKRATTAEERDVEAPDIFQSTEDGLWDGRPSLGGVWVAHPEVTDPERVIIRNEDNGNFVIGALFRRERNNPGPRFMVSSDAAAALGLLAGQPTRLNVTALRIEKVEPEVEPEIAAAAAPTEGLADPEEIQATSLDDPLASASAAIDAAEAKTAEELIAADTENPVITPAAAAPAPAAGPAPVSNLKKPFIQIGIFSVEANAKKTADNMRAAGIVPSVIKGESKGKAFWRVIVGPANTTGERGELLSKVKGLGFGDAYFVTN